MTDIQSILDKYQLLEQRNKAIMDELEQLESDALYRRLRPDSWNIIQVLNHVRVAEEGTLGYIKKKMKYGGIKSTDWSNPIRARLMTVVNNSSLRFKMPSVLKPPSDEGSIPEIKAQWAELRVSWKEYIRNFPEEYLDKAVFKHPIFGRLSLTQAMDSMITHQNHHYKQIKRIKKGLMLNVN